MIYLVKHCQVSLSAVEFKVSKFHLGGDRVMDLEQKKKKKKKKKMKGEDWKEQVFQFLCFHFPFFLGYLTHTVLYYRLDDGIFYFTYTIALLVIAVVLLF